MNKLTELISSSHPGNLVTFKKYDDCGESWVQISDVDNYTQHFKMKGPICF